MKRALATVALTSICIVSLAAVANAGSATVSNDYQGHAEKDSHTYVGFNLAKKHGKTKVSMVKALLSYKCQNGDGGILFGRSRGSVRVRSDKTFGGKLKVKSSPSRGGSSFRNFTFNFHGKLGKKGKAHGTIRGDLDFTSMMRAKRRGAAATVHCYSGGLDWKAKKGADTFPTIPIVLKTEGLR